MEAFFQSIELVRGLNLCNKLPTAMMNYILDEIFKLILNLKNSFEKSNIKNYLKKEKINLNENDTDSMLDCLVNLLRLIRKKEIPPKKLQSFISENTLLKEDYVQLIVEKYEQSLQLDENQAVKTLQLGKLIDIKWQVCSYLDDKQFQNLNKMYILLNLAVQTVTGEVIRETINLSLTEFKAFQKIVQEVQNTLQNYAQ